jgi:hypothetical protein
MKKVILLSLFFLLTAISVFSLEYWNDARVTFTQDEDTDYWAFRNNHIAEYYLKDLYLQLDMNSFISELSDEKNIEERNSYVYNELKSFLQYKIKSHSLIKLGFNNNYYDYDKSWNNFFIDGINVPTQTLAKNYSYLVYEGNYKDFKLVTGLRLRSNYIDYQFDGMDFQANEFYTYDEFYKDIYLSYNFNDKMSIYTDFYNKSFYSEITSLYDPKREHDVTEYGIGINYTNNDFFYGRVMEDLYYQKRDSEQYQDYQEDYFIYNLRYVFPVTSNLNAFCSYISHFSYASQEEEFYRLANMVRLQMRYDLPADYSDAYLIAGTRLNPENESRRYFIEAKYPLLERLYCRINETYFYEAYNKVSTALEYYISPASHVYIESNYTDSLDKSNLYKYKNNFTIGTRIYF